MKTCFGFIFWGFLLVALNFKFNAFDVTPNFVGGLGYALMAIGAGGLASISANFVVACSLAWLIVLAYIAGANLAEDARKAFDVLLAVVNCATIWTTLAGVGDIANGRNRLDLARRAGPARWAYVALTAASLILGVTAQGTGPAVWVITAGVVAAALAVSIFVLHVLYRAWAELSP